MNYELLEQRFKEEFEKYGQKDPMVSFIWAKHFVKVAQEVAKESEPIREGDSTW